MQTQLARMASRTCVNIAACMPSTSQSTRSISALGCMVSETCQTSLQITISQLQQGSALTQFPFWHDTPHLPIDGHTQAHQAVLANMACTPLMPAQVQAALRVVQVQQMACISPAAIEQEEKHTMADPEGMLCATKRTYQPSVIIRKRRHGFLNRVSSHGGRNVMRRRKAKGRYSITA